MLNILKEYINNASKSQSGILAFQAITPDFHDDRQLPDLKDKLWTKGDLLDHFHVRDRTEIIETPTYGSGIIFVRKSKKSTRHKFQKEKSSLEGQFTYVLHL